MAVRPSSYGANLNILGQVSGYSFTAGNVDYHAFINNGGVLTDLGTLGGSYSWAKGSVDLPPKV